MARKAKSFRFKKGKLIEIKRDGYFLGMDKEDIISNTSAGRYAMWQVNSILNNGMLANGVNINLNLSEDPRLMIKGKHVMLLQKIKHVNESQNWGYTTITSSAIYNGFGYLDSCNLYKVLYMGKVGIIHEDALKEEVPVENNGFSWTFNGYNHPNNWQMPQQNIQVFPYAQPTSGYVRVEPTWVGGGTYTSPGPLYTPSENEIYYSPTTLPAGTSFTIIDQPHRINSTTTIKWK